MTVSPLPIRAGVVHAPAMWKLAQRRAVVALADGRSGRLQLWHRNGRASVVIGGRHYRVPHDHIIGIIDEEEP